MEPETSQQAQVQTQVQTRGQEQLREQGQAHKPVPAPSQSQIQSDLRFDAQLQKDSATKTSRSAQASRPAPEKPQTTQAINGEAYQLTPLDIRASGSTGRLRNRQLKELSGLAASRRHKGLLYAINDSGNSPTVYAIDETGKLLHQWEIAARNRDWEDMTMMTINGESYIVIGETGDNLLRHSTASLYFLSEPQWPPTTTTLDVDAKVDFTYEDGPKNVEAVSAAGSSVYLLSKTSQRGKGNSTNGVYQLQLSPDTIFASGQELMTARRVASMASRGNSIETTLAAALAGVNLNNPTALEIDSDSNTAYILTYREVLKIPKAPQQTWSQAFASKSTRIAWHSLSQAEALSVSPGRAIWFTSEKMGSEIRAIALDPPL